MLISMSISYIMVAAITNHNYRHISSSHKEPPNRDSVLLSTTTNYLNISTDKTYTPLRLETVYCHPDTPLQVAPREHGVPSRLGFDSRPKLWFNSQPPYYLKTRENQCNLSLYYTSFFYLLKWSFRLGNVHQTHWDLCCGQPRGQRILSGVFGSISGPQSISKQKRNYLISQYIFQSGFYLKFECYRLFIDLQGPLLGVAERSWSLHSGLWFDSWPREYFKTAEKQPCPSIYFRWRFILNSNGKSCPVTSRDLCWEQLRGRGVSTVKFMRNIWSNNSQNKVNYPGGNCGTIIYLSQSGHPTNTP